MDLSDTKGGVPGEICEQAAQEENANTTSLGEDPNSIRIQIPISHLTRSSQTILTTGANVGGLTVEVAASSAVGMAINASDLTLACGCQFEVGMFSTTDASKDVKESTGGPTLTSGCSDSYGVLAHSANSMKLTI